MGAITRIQEAGVVSGGLVNSIGVSFEEPTTPGDLLIALISTTNIGATVSTMPSGWVEAVHRYDTSGNYVIIAYCANAPLTTTNVTFGLNEFSWAVLVIAEYAGVDPSSPLDQTNSALGSGIAISGDITTTFSDTLVIVGLSGTFPAFTSPATNGFTLLIESSYGNSDEIHSGYLELSTVGAGTYSTSMLENGSFCTGVIANFRSAPVVFNAQVALQPGSFLTIANLQFGISDLQSQAIVIANTLYQTSAVLIQLSATSQQGIAFSISATFTTTLGIPVTGQVILYNGMTILSSSLIDVTDTATWVVDGLSIGQHSLTATYVGDSNYLAYQTVPLIHNVVSPTTGIAGVGSSRHDKVKRLINFLSSIPTDPSTAVSYIISVGGIVVNGSTTQTLNFSPTGPVKGVYVGGAAVVSAQQLQWRICYNPITSSCPTSLGNLDNNPYQWTIIREGQW
jgi:hypothetical protein